jgi:pimeloyl-ACP methyl ester carboxylesterase
MAAWLSEELNQGIHALTGGAGPTVVLIPGWPETAEAYGEVFPFLEKSHSIICVDPPGIGDSAPSSGGYDTGTISKLLEVSLQPRAEEPFHLVGHDVGAWIAYAWAAQFPDRVRSLVLLDSALPGLVPPQAFPLPFEVNVKLWQLSFNSLPELPEILTKGRERELFDWLFRNKAKYPERVSIANRNRYVASYARPGAMSNGFAYYRAAALSASQNREFGKRKLQMPVLALGGRNAMGDNLRSSMESLAVHLNGGVIEDCGHYVMEEQPEVVARRSLDFFKSVEILASARRRR